MDEKIAQLIHHFDKTLNDFEESIRKINTLLNLFEIYSSNTTKSIIYQELQFVDPNLAEIFKRRNEF